MKKQLKIKTGSLVTVLPAATGFYIVIATHKPFESGAPNDPILYDTETGFVGPMQERWIKVLSE